MPGETESTEAPAEAPVVPAAPEVIAASPELVERGGINDPLLCVGGKHEHYWMTSYAESRVLRRCAKCARREKATELNKDGTVKTWEQIPPN